MTLAPDTRLGPYEILALLGAGGMGEVYRARDTRLNRDVAIKILPPAVADNPTRRARFAREAQSISQLSHPHICTIHDVGEAGGIAFLVMEYIEGESLEKRLRLGPLPWATALEWAIQIAAAIDAAHRRGIAHRDLKPANIMIAESGIKLLDFGLAKLLEPPDETTRPTESLTAEQRLVGTLHYMSPEQLEGRDVDARTDVFAFGVTLYEMVTGRKAFDGTSAASVSAAILTSEPLLVSSSAVGETAIPPAFDHIIRRALAKHPDERWQTVRDVMLELRWLKESRPRAVPPMSSTRRGPRWLALAAGTAAIGVLGGTLGWRIAIRQRGPSSQPPIVFTIAAPPNMSLAPGYGTIAVAPDGRKIAFVAGSEASPKLLWWQSLGSTVAHVLPGTEEARGPFWSPDSNSVGFYSRNNSQLQRIGINGGAAVVVTDLVWRRLGATNAAFWAEDDTIVFGQPGGLYRVKATGGQPVQIMPVGSMPSAFPGGRILYLVPPARSDSALNIHGPGMSTPVVVPVQSNAAFAAGQLVFREGQSLVARPFDEQALQFTGPPVTLAEGVSFNPLNGRTQFDVSKDLLAYRREDRRKLTWRDRNGRPHGSIGEIGQDWDPAIAPDGSGRVALDRHDPLTDGFHVWIIDDHGRSTQITSGTRERWPTWSPDGKWIVHWAINGDTHELRRRSSDGRGAGEVLLQQAGRLTPLDYSRDGRFLVYQPGQLRSIDARSNASDEGDDLWMLPLVGDDRQPRRITNTPKIAETTARLSPDVRWIAYTSQEGGQANIWAQEFPSGTSKRQISVNGGMDPNWSADGKELFYVALDGTLMAVPVTTGSVFTFGSSVPLFKFDPGPLVPLHLYSATPDGQRFLVSEMSGAPAVITLVVHWTSLLR